MQNIAALKSEVKLFALAVFGLSQHARRWQHATGEIIGTQGLKFAAQASLLLKRCQ